MILFKIRYVCSLFSFIFLNTFNDRTIVQYALINPLADTLFINYVLLSIFYNRESQNQIRKSTIE